MSIGGGCFCGAFRYTIDYPVKVICACHCTDCQRLTGSACSMAALVPDKAWHTNNAAMNSHVSATDGGGRKTRWVCAVCSTWVFGGSPIGSTLPGTIRFIRAGTLDDTSRLRPTVHFWTRSAQPWIVLPKDNSIFETQPPNLGKWVAQNS